MTADTQNRALCATLTAQERRVWDALVQGDSEADKAALDVGFLGVYPSGFAGRQDHVSQLTDGPTIRHYALSDLRAMELGHGHGLLSYMATFQRVSREEEERMYVTSVWARRGDGWVNVFSQDTLAS